MELASILLVLVSVLCAIVVVLFRSHYLHQVKLAKAYLKANAIRMSAEIGSEINEEIARTDNKIRVLYALQIILCGIAILAIWWSMGINGILC